MIMDIEKCDILDNFKTRNYVFRGMESPLTKQRILFVIHVLRLFDKDLPEFSHKNWFEKVIIRAFFRSNFIVSLDNVNSITIYDQPQRNTLIEKTEALIKNSPFLSMFSLQDRCYIYLAINHMEEMTKISEPFSNIQNQIHKVYQRCHLKKHFDFYCQDRIDDLE